MSTDDDPILAALRKLAGKVDAAPVMLWGTVTQSSPLMVTLDGAIDPSGAPVAVPAQSAVGALVAGQRVYCVRQSRRVIVVGTSSSPVYPPSAEVPPSGNRAFLLDHRDHPDVRSLTVASPGEEFYIEVVAKRLTGSAPLNPRVGQYTSGGMPPSGAQYWQTITTTATVQLADLGNGWVRLAGRSRLLDLPDISRAAVWLQIDQQVPYDTKWAVSDIVMRRVAMPLQVSDTGWQTIPLAAGITAVSTGERPMYRVKNGICYVRGGISTAGFTAGSASKGTGTFPAEARPTVNQMGAIGTWNAPELHATFVVAAGSGDWRIQPQATGTLPGYWFFGGQSWPVN